MSQRNMVQMQCRTGALGRVMTRLVPTFSLKSIVEVILYILHTHKVEKLSVAPKEAFGKRGLAILLGLLAL